MPSLKKSKASTHDQAAATPRARVAALKTRAARLKRPKAVAEQARSVAPLDSHVIPADSSDPVFAAIEACRAAVAQHDRLHAICASLPDMAPEWKPEKIAHARYWRLWNKGVLTTTPQTAAGARALASFALEFAQTAGVDFDGRGAEVLALIAASPILDAGSRPRAIGDSRADPVHALIAAARLATQRANEPHPGDGAPNGSPESRAAEAQTASRTELEDQAFLAVFEARPTTREGLLALVNYTRERAGFLADLAYGEEGLMAAVLNAISDGMAMLTDGFREAVAPDPVFEIIRQHRASYDALNAMADDGPEADAASEHEDMAWARLLATRPTTAAGLLALVRALGLGAKAHSHMDGEPHLFAAIVDGLSVLMGANPRSDSQARALIEAIEREWPRYSTEDRRGLDANDPEAEDRWDAHSKRLDDILAAADALPADTREARHAKALALAWSEFVGVWERGAKRHDYGLVGRLAFDIEAGICRPATERSVLAPIACDAARIGSVIDRLHAEILRLDEAGAGRPSHPLRVQFLTANDTAEKLREALSYARARSPEGALVQIAVATYDLEGIDGGATQQARRTARDRSERLLHSVSAAIARLHGIDREGYGAGHYLSANLDRLSILDTDTAGA